MKAAVLKKFGDPLVWEEVPTPEPGPEEVRLQVMACGTDGTDLKMVQGFGYTPVLPFIIGHEITGVVDAVGSRVTDWQPGARAIAYNFFPCGRCRHCLTHREQICQNMAGVMGARVKHGGYAEYLCLPARQVVAIPAHVSWPDAAVIPDAVITALHGVDRARLQLNETVLIFGAGGVGSSAIQIAKMRGARVAAVDRSADKVRRALEMGADAAWNSCDSDSVQLARDFSQGFGVDCVIDVVGVEQTMAAGIEALRPGGRLVVIGYTPEVYGLNGKRLAQNELEIIGTRAGRFQDLIDSVEVVAGGRFKSIVTDLFPMEEVNRAMDALRAGEILGRAVLLTPAGRKTMEVQ
ncbi:MAG: zinc-binding dehydrogenase [Acidobacteria bacterium]|nr:zinc-binding dehydrogenase [Acidobacteriota bacterium]